MDSDVISTLLARANSNGRLLMTRRGNLANLALLDNDVRIDAVAKLQLEFEARTEVRIENFR